MADAPATKTSAFKVASTVKHNGETLRKGATVRLTSKEADHLLKTGAVKPNG